MADDDVKPEDDGTDARSVKLADVHARYAAFLAHNPLSKIVSFAHDDGELLVIEEPWGDKSVGIIIGDNDDELCDALNSLYLPPRYTAIYHRDDFVLEVIWTAYKLDASQQEIVGRKFALNLPNSNYECEFRESSNKLLEIAKNVIPLEISTTGFRNLQSFNAYLNNKDEDNDADYSAYGSPLSFWIGGIDWDEDKVIDLIRHLNFYLKYYDNDSPTIEIHPQSSNESAPKNRYFDGFQFPEKIVSSTLDSKLLVMYSSGFSKANPSTSFLNFYRVIEYVSLDYAHVTAREEVRSIITRPHALHSVERTATELMLVLREIKNEREQEAIPKLLKEVTDPSQLWREIEPNKAYFSSTIEFEGGLCISPIITEKTDSESFGVSSVEAFARACSKIRNGLAHGRDKISTESILPTSKNFDQLRPWVNVLAVCAGEVVLYAGQH